jgi:MoaA/NifB/PqqE/SkfB family radical SAM enzyme
MGLAKLLKSGAAKGIVFENPFYRAVYLKSIKNKAQKLTKNYPQFVDIETTNVCNSRCIICPHSIMNRKQGIMKMDLFTKIADNCKSGGIKNVSLSFFGEPLLDPLIFDRIKYVKGLGIPSTAFSTNASLMDETMSKKIIESGLDLMYISLDGASSETYNKIRVGLDFDRVVSNISRFFELKMKMKSETPAVKMRFVVINKNRQEVEKYLNMWSKDADDIHIATFDNWGGSVDLDETKTSKRARYACQEPFKRLLILWDGRVAICCRDYEGFHIIGDMNRSSIEEINLSSEMERIRKIHLDRKFDELKLCSNCSRLNSTHSVWWYEHGTQKD